MPMFNHRTPVSSPGMTFPPNAVNIGAWVGVVGAKGLVTSSARGTCMAELRYGLRLRDRRRECGELWGHIKVWGKNR